MVNIQSKLELNEEYAIEFIVVLLLLQTYFGHNVIYPSIN